VELVRTIQRYHREAIAEDELQLRAFWRQWYGYMLGLGKVDTKEPSVQGAVIGSQLTRRGQCQKHVSEETITACLLFERMWKTFFTKRRPFG